MTLLICVGSASMLIVPNAFGATLDECCVVCIEIKSRPSDVRTKGVSQTSPEKRSACLLP